MGRAGRGGQDRYDEHGTPQCKLCREYRDDIVKPHQSASAICPDCLSEALSSWSGHVGPNTEARWRSKYGLDASKHVMMYVQQRGLCAICRDPLRSARTETNHVSGLVVDHNHETGKVRGLLCSRCNTAIGLLGDDPDYVQRAYLYLTGKRMTLRKPREGVFDDAIASLEHTA